MVRVWVQGKPVGSGFLVDSRHVLTCAHVVRDAQDETDIKVQLAGLDPLVAVGRSLVAGRTLPGLDREVDAAVLVLSDGDHGLPAVRLAAAYSPDELNKLVQRVRGLVPHGFPAAGRDCAPSTVAGLGGGQDAFADDLGTVVLDRALETRAIRGMSGGPVLVERDGERLCIGMNRLGGDEATSAVMIATRPLQLLLEQAGWAGPEPRALGAWLGPRERVEDRGSFLAEQAAELASLDNLLVEEGLSVEFAERVYVELSVGRTGGMESLGDGPHGTWTLDGVLGEEPERFGAASHHWLVLGDPGSGKTTTLGMLARRNAGASRGSWTPLYLRLPRLGQALGSRGDGWQRLRVALEKEFGAGPDRLALFEEERAAGRLLLLLDGWDEVQENRDAVRSWLGLLSRSVPGAGIVVASRKLPKDRLSSGYLEAELQPMEREDQVRFLMPWIPDSDADRAEGSARKWVDFLNGFPPLHGFQGNPLGLTLVGFLLRAGETPATRRHELLLQVIDTILHGRTAGRSEGISNPIAVRRALQAMALHFTGIGRDEFTEQELGEFFEDLPAESVREELRETSPWRTDMARFVREIRDRTCVLGPHRGPNRWAFWHRSFQEALTAQALAALGGLDQQLSEVGKLDESHLAYWAEPFAMLAEDAPDADGLLLALHERKLSGLALRALLSVPERQLQKDTLLAVLELGEEQEAEDRGRAILRAPALLGTDDDARVRSLELFDTLARRLQRSSETFWSDLYFVDEALRKAGEQEGMAQASLERRLGVLEAWFPFPSEWKLREVGLLQGATRWEPWPVIPATEEVWLGSPEDEAGGSKDETLHRVALSAFRLGATPVTRGQYELFDPDHACPGPADAPVTKVDWYQAVLFSRWIGFALGDDPGDLPTEAQWEYACRGGKQTAYWSGNTKADLDRVGWFEENSGGRPHPVGEKPANAYGLYDVHGNVWEWCADWYGEYGSDEAGRMQDPSGPTRGGYRVLRGGSFWSGAGRCRSAYRGGNRPDDRYDDYGFRVALPVAEARSSKLE